MIRLSTLGFLHVAVDDREVTSLLAQRKRLAVLTYIAVAGPLVRDRVLGVFWPDFRDEKAGHALSQSLYVLRRELGNEAISYASGRLMVNREAVTVDCLTFEQLAEDQEWDAALELYHGPFLDDLVIRGAHEFEEWQSNTRARYARLARRAFAHAISMRAKRGDLEPALATATRWAELEPLQDEAQHAAISLLGTLGRRSQALGLYEAYRERLARAIEVEPLDETVALAARIKAGETVEPEVLGIAPPSDAQTKELVSIGDSPSWRAGLADDQKSLDSLLKEELGPRLNIVRQLASGSKATIYLAREPQLRRLVAIKLFSPDLAANDRARKRFEREAKAIATISHPNVVTIFWAGSLLNGLPYIVMQYVKGRTVRGLLKLEGKVTFDRGVHIIRAVASALSAAHMKGVVHRDICPANILLEEETGRVLLTDFGYAALLPTAEFEAPPPLTTSGELIARPPYASPERVRGEEITEKSDVYSLGILAYELLTGEGPYDAESAVGLLEAHMHQTPHRLGELLSELDPQIDKLLYRCLAKRPEERPNASDVVRLLRSSL